MKRSDVLLLMADIINDAKFGRLDVEMDSHQLAQKILQVQEDAGMQPPIQEKQHGGCSWADLEWEGEEDEQV